MTVGRALCLALAGFCSGYAHSLCAAATPIAPIKALCTEMVQNFNDKFAPFGVTCGELTGDVEDMRAATRHPIVCATPEKVRLEYAPCLVQSLQLAACCADSHARRRPGSGTPSRGGGMRRARPPSWC